jgi:uncharacterized protein YdaU (DUF1376 family)
MGAKLLAEWFWTDRWIGSSGFLLPMEARGVYREMLTQSWRRGAKLPNDFEAIRRAIGATPAEWRRTWPKVAGFWRVEGDNLVNDTQLAVYAATVSLHRVRGAAGQVGGRVTQANRQANRQAKLNPPSPSPSPYVPPVAPQGGRVTTKECTHVPRCPNRWAHGELVRAEASGDGDLIAGVRQVNAKKAALV